MELRCYEDGRPLSPDEQAVLAVRRGSESASGGTDTERAGGELALFHVDCYPAESGDWVLLRQGQAGLLHDTPP